MRFSSQSLLAATLTSVNAVSRQSKIGKRSERLNLFAPVPLNVTFLSVNPSKKREEKKEASFTYALQRTSPYLHMQQTKESLIDIFFSRFLHMNLCHREESLSQYHRGLLGFSTCSCSDKISHSVLQCLCERGHQIRSIL